MWEILRDDNFDWEPIIQPGLDKLEDYWACLVDTPACVVAMGETSIFYYLVDCQLNIIQWLTKPSQCFVVLDRLAWCEKMT